MMGLLLWMFGRLYCWLQHIRFHRRDRTRGSLYVWGFHLTHPSLLRSRAGTTSGSETRYTTSVSGIFPVAPCSTASNVVIVTKFNGHGRTNISSSNLGVGIPGT